MPKPEAVSDDNIPEIPLSPAQAKKRRDASIALFMLQKRTKLIKLINGAICNASTSGRWLIFGGVVHELAGSDTMEQVLAIYRSKGWEIRLETTDNTKKQIIILDRTSV